MKLHKYDDPGHGWLKVPTKQWVKALVLNPSLQADYMTPTAVFLEEDCEMSEYLNTLETTGIDWEIEGHHTNKSSKIRSYGGYRHDMLGGLFVGYEGTFWTGAPFKVIAEKRGHYVIFMENQKYRLPKNTFSDYMK